MLKELTRSDWLKVLGLPESRVPAALILRGTRNFRSKYAAMLPHFDNVSRAGNQVSFTLRGTAGAPYTVETSTDLANWVSLGVFTTNAATGTVPVNHTTTNAQRYYRAVSKP